MRHIITAIRIASLIIFLYTAVSITWQSMLALSLLLVSVFLLKPDRRYVFAGKITHRTKNPFKGRSKVSEDDLPGDMINAVQKKICDFITVDARNCDSVARFEQIKMNTHCIFAKNALLWGNTAWNNDNTVEENTSRDLPTFLKFTCLCEPLGLDGFVFEMPGEKFGTSPEVFGAAVRKLLCCIASRDPSGKNCMTERKIDSLGWVFEFNKHTFFITSFAPFYSEHCPRYSFGAEHCYVLFQPEISFALHDLPNDTPHTNWIDPKTIRDRIRVAFKDAGRPYLVRSSTRYPMAYDIIKPLQEGEDPIQWWTFT